MKPITIALPGEKRNQISLQSLLFREGLIDESDLGKEVLALKSLGVRAVTLRSSDAVRLLLQGRITGVINGIDALTEGLLSERMKIRQEREGGLISGSNILGYERLPLRFGERLPRNQSLTYEGVFDTLPGSSLRPLMRSEDEAKIPGIASLASRGDILTPYPLLVRALLSRRFGGSNIGTIEGVDGKTEALLASGYGASAVDIVDTGETARRNNLTVGEPLFESYPAFLVSDREREEDLRVRGLVESIREISNTLYYNSQNYREKYPRG